LTEEELGSVTALALEFRTRLLRAEKEAAQEITRLYRAARKTILAELSHLMKRIRSAELAGEEISADWLRRERRFRSLAEQIDKQLERFSRRSATITEGRRGEVITTAARNAERLLGEIGVTFDVLPVRVLEELASRIAQGSPLRALFAEMAAEIGEAVAQELFTGLATGRGIRKTSIEIAKVLGGAENRAHLIARTETLNAYRNVALAQYQDAGIGKWMWLAAKGPRTCAACLAMDGQEFLITTPFASHVSCTCHPVPVVGELPAYQSGADWFAQQDEETQIGIIGKKGAELYRSGQLKLADFVQDTHSPVYGPGRRQRSIAELRRLGRVA
jgi:SPP1 gp7 family putative phage head morphogenesis protein